MHPFLSQLIVRPFQRLKLPAVLRSEKVHNCSIVLDHVKKRGVSLSGIGNAKEEFLAAEIVDGDREASLSLLWKIVAQFQVI